MRCKPFVLSFQIEPVVNELLLQIMIDGVTFDCGNTFEKNG